MYEMADAVRSEGKMLPRFVLVYNRSRTLVTWMETIFVRINNTGEPIAYFSTSKLTKKRQACCRFIRTFAIVPAAIIVISDAIGTRRQGCSQAVRPHTGK